MGDYFHMVSDSNGASLAWAATFNNEQDVYYSYIATTIVPVELVSFSYSVEGNTVNLSWSTATELNNRGFEIQRSLNETNWSTIGFREGKGTTSEPQQYSYLDNLSGVESSRLYYRLKQIDFDGSFEYSNTIEVEITPSVFSLSQNYPNPFNPSTKIKYSIPQSSNVVIKVFNVVGDEVSTLVNGQKQAGTYELTFNAENLPSGVYFYQLKAGDFIQTKRMILIK
ncbi:MAG: T9SS type A sorting domain-containing protein [Ignavibacteriaceae bacterium]|nr:T9SS type A sorting domain-containing protein [Ignavibacteriaceae bacterium]